METLDKLYNCKDYAIKIELNNGKVSSVCDTPLNPNENNMLVLLYNIDGKMKGSIILTDGVSKIREPFDMSPLRFTRLNQALENILNDNDWKRTFNAFASTKLAPMNCNKSETKKAYDISIEEFLLDYDIECFHLESEIRDYEDLGRTLVDVEGLDIPMELQEHIDYSSYAHDWNCSESCEPEGIMTRFGYLYYSEYGSKF